AAVRGGYGLAGFEVGHPGAAHGVGVGALALVLEGEQALAVPAGRDQVPAPAPRRLEHAVAADIEAELCAAQLVVGAQGPVPCGFGHVFDHPWAAGCALQLAAGGDEVGGVVAAAAPGGDAGLVLARSEEHTSELQSR